jgi:hypothetical protein
MLIKRAWVAGVALFGIFVSPRPAGEPEWLRSNGTNWQQWSPEARQAYITGFLAGSATQQALATGAADSAALVRAMAGVVEGQQLSFPFGPNVYGVRVDDYYWWTDRRAMPLWYVMWDVHRSLQQDSGEGR